MLRDYTFVVYVNDLTRLTSFLNLLSICEESKYIENVLFVYDSSRLSKSILTSIFSEIFDLKLSFVSFTMIEKTSNFNEDFFRVISLKISKYIKTKYYCVLKLNDIVQKININKKLPLKLKNYRESDDDIDITRSGKSLFGYVNDYYSFDLYVNRIFYYITNISTEVVSLFNKNTGNMSMLGVNANYLYLIYLNEIFRIDSYYELDNNLYEIHTKEIDNKYYMCFDIICETTNDFDIDILFNNKLSYYRNRNAFTETSINFKKTSAFNPSFVLLTNGDLYGIARSESLISEEEHNWKDSSASYIGGKFGLNGNIIGENFEFILNTGTNEYSEIVRKHSNKQKYTFEDIRFIHDTEYKNEYNETCYLASVVVCRKYLLGSKITDDVIDDDIDVKVAVCEVNFDSKSINFLNYIHEDYQNIIEKNWGMFKHDNKFGAIYSYEPLVYDFANTHDEIKFKKFPKKVNKKYELFGLSISCNPLQINETEYLIILHTKLKINYPYYKFYIAKFKIENNRIIKSTNMRRINIPDKFHFCCSLLKVNEDIKVYFGKHDCKSFEMELNKDFIAEINFY